MEAVISLLIYGSGTITNPIKMSGSATNGLAQIATGNTSGSLALGNFGLPTNSTAGFIHLGNMAGQPTGTPVSSTQGMPIVADTTNANLWAYNSSIWKGVHFLNIQPTYMTINITAHAGGGQGSATALTSQINIITTVATTADSVILPAAASLSEIVVINRGANSLAVFPNSGAQIEASGANTSVTIAAGTSATFDCVSNTQWYQR